LPASFLGSALILVTQRLDVGADGRLLADVRFRRDTRGRWCIVAQRAPLPPRAPVPIEARRVAFLDPGCRAAQTAYLPDGADVIGDRKRAPSAGATVAYLEGAGGASMLIQLARRVDAIVKKSRAIAKTKATTHAQRRTRRRALNKLNRSERKLRDRLHSLMSTAHVQAAHDVFSRVDTVVVPIFETARMVKRAKAPGDPVRRINRTTVRQMLALRHRDFCLRLHRVANLLGKECVNVREEYTTIGCPNCLHVSAKFSGKTFRCARCGHTAPRDAKAGLTLAIKCLDPESQERL